MHSSRRYSLFAVLLLLASSAGAQSFSAEQIKSLVTAFKADPRGPYQAIRWFCPDGTVLPPNERCPQRGGIQHALPKESVVSLARHNGVHLGQILAGTAYADFLDEERQHSRLKQYQIESFLQHADDGWIVRRARYYRGAVQAEDEAAWSETFIRQLVSDTEFIETRYFLLRQIARDLPRSGVENLWQSIRALAKTVSDIEPAFTDLRIKLHGQPDPKDQQRVLAFLQSNKGRLKPAADSLLNVLSTDLAKAWRPTSIQELSRYAGVLTREPGLTAKLSRLISSGANQADAVHPTRFGTIATAVELLRELRKRMAASTIKEDRLAMLDLSIELESLVFREAQTWHASTLRELSNKVLILGEAASACGYLETWEWQAVRHRLVMKPEETHVTLGILLDIAASARRAVEWSAAMVRAVYGPEITLFSAFEPLANGFIDDRIRSTILLPFGDASSALATIASEKAGSANQVMDVDNQFSIRGLNPGFARGILEVVDGPSEKIAFAPDKIYVLLNAPGDLKPVAGVATVSEGNLVSHVQLLARNLGIPNAVLSESNLRALARYSGQRVFYAVSPRGTVIMKPEVRMTQEERQLVEVKARNQDRIRVPVNRLDRSTRKILNLRELRASDSGKLSGPKAATLGQLKHMFPDRVVEGLVLPFGIFYEHMQQTMPNGSQTYWQALQGAFARAAALRQASQSEEQVESALLKDLQELRSAMAAMPFKEDFIARLEQQFRDVLGAELGKIPVFVRSDTNMEDLKDFTGAGLNLTVFNALERERILQGIRDVWASPYTERSYRWRQKFLLNPEDVYPSILLIPSVDVDKSGVLITAGVHSGDLRGVTLAFNRGAGGAVEGQNAESWQLHPRQVPELLSPAREFLHNRLPATGGTKKQVGFFNRRILDPEELRALWDLSSEMRRRLPGAPGIDSDGPFDVELGLKDGHIWLFQVRPYVENSRARSSAYLRSLDPPLKLESRIPLIHQVN